MFSRREKGFVQFGVIALIIVTAGLFAATKLASNPDLTFFNLGEYAKVSEEEQCGGCVNGYRLRWNKQRNRCLKTLSASCVIKPKPTTPPTPKPSPNNGVPVTFDSGYVKLNADDFSIFANGKLYGRKMANLHVGSDPNDSGDPNYTTLEVTWDENGTEMRLFMYFYKNNEKWWMSEMRIYNGKKPGDWFTVVPFPNGTSPDTPTLHEVEPNYSAKLGQVYKGLAGYLFTNGDAVVGSVDFGNLELTAFTKKVLTPSPFPRPIPSPVVCTQVITRAYNLKTGECKDFSTPCDVPSDWTNGYCFWSPQD